MVPWSAAEEMFYTSVCSREAREWACCVHTVGLCLVWPAHGVD